MLETLCCDFGNGNVSIVVRDAEMKCEGDKRPPAVATHQAGCLNAKRLLTILSLRHEPAGREFESTQAAAPRIVFFVCHVIFRSLRRIIE